MDAISVVCITHRKGELLRATLTGVLDQLGPADEVLVIDDGGEDRPIFATLAAAHAGARMRYFRVPHTGYRLSLLCNIGIMLAAHERIVKMDGDVVPRPGWIETYRRALVIGTLVCGRIEWRLQDGGVARDSRFDYTRRQGCVEPRKSYGGNLGFLRRDLLDLGLFDPGYHGAWGAEDAEIGEKYRLSERRVVFDFDAAVEHQWHPPCEFRSGVARNRRRLRERVRRFERGRLPDPLPRDSLRIVLPTRAGCVENDDGELASTLAELNLPYDVAPGPFEPIVDDLRPGEFALVVARERDLNASTIERLYVHLKSDERCPAVTSADGGSACVLHRAHASRAQVVTLP